MGIPTSSGVDSCSTIVDFFVDRLRVVRPDLGAEAVLERGDDPAAVRVVLGVRRRAQDHVERQPHLVAADLDVALLEQVQQRDLDPLGEVRKLVDREDAAVRPGDQAVVDRELVGEVAALGDLDRVDLTDEVGDRDVRCRELLRVAVLGRRASGSACRRPARRPAACTPRRSARSGSSLISQPAIAGSSGSSSFVRSRMMRDFA